VLLVFVAGSFSDPPEFPFHWSGQPQKVVSSIGRPARRRRVAVASSGCTCRARCTTSAFEFGLRDCNI
jgi:hypothetical protein